MLTGKFRRALDSTVLDDAVATQDTVTQLIASIRRVRREVPGAADVVDEFCTAHDYDDPGKPAIAWDDTEARERLVDALVTDAHRLLGHLPEQELGPQAADAVALLALVAGQDVEPAEGSDGTDGRWRIARRVAGSGDLHRRPGRAARTQNRVSPAGRIQGPRRDRAGHRDRHRLRGDQDRRRGQPSGTDVGCSYSTTRSRLRVLADSAYGSGEFRAELADAGHTAVITRTRTRGGCGRVHRRRLRRRPRQPHRDLPGRAHPHDQPRRQRYFGMRPATAARFGIAAPPAPEARNVKLRPARPDSELGQPAGRRDPELANGISAASADGRTRHRLARPRQPQTPLPRCRQERHLAPPPCCRAQPPPTRHPGPAHTGTTWAIA